MKAILCTRYGGPDDLEFSDVPDPVPGAGEVVVTVKAAALNFFDTLIIAGKYQFKPPFPFSPASEFAGVVESVGAGVTGFPVGDRVLKKGGRLAAYDVAVGNGMSLHFPVPWARTARTSFVVRPGAYRRRLDCAGFDLHHERDRSEFAIEFFREMRARIAEKGTPPLGAHIVMGKDFQDKTGNIIANLERKLIAPIEMISRVRAAYVG